jgi:hypothetical protein
MDPKEQLKQLRKRLKVLAVKADLTDEEAKELEKLTADAVKLEAQITALEQVEKADAEEKKAQDAAIKAEVDKQVSAAKAEMRRLPGGEGAPFLAKFGDTWKFDNLTPGELSLAINILNSSNKGVASPSAMKALAIKIIEDKRDFGQPELAPSYSLGAMKACGLEPTIDAVKAATDPMYTGGTTDGAYWTGTAYARELWGVIRASQAIVGKIPSVVIPDGFPAEAFPIEGTDPTWYTAAEASSSDGTLKVPAATVAASQVTTPAQKTLSIKKMGARVIYTGEMTEDALISFAPQLRKQMEISGGEQLEHAVIDGDTTTTAYTNVNDVGNSAAVTAGSLFLMLDGLRKLALVTNTANSRSAAGGFVIEDFMATLQLMGTAGLAAADLAKVSFIVDPNVWFAAMNLPEAKTRDVNSAATIENGFLKRAYGVEILPSWFMHYKSTARKANSAGKVDQTTVANNAYGSILGVRWDQWKFGYKRQMTMETTRIANADAWEIVAWARLGLTYRDTEASAISYYVGC